MMKLPTRIVEKPWGRTDIPLSFVDFGARRIGEIWFEDPDGDAAPLMVKLLFTSQRLSIQVHPDDAAARAAGFPRGKEECWLVLDAEPDAELGVGLKAPSSTEALRAAALDGSIEALIDWRSANVGDFVYNAAGTIHAIGAGLMVVEVQQNVDCTYRLYDYGRPRELHLDEGLAVARTDPHDDPRDTHIANAVTQRLVSGPHFNVIHAAGLLDYSALPSDQGRYTIVPLGHGCTVDGEALSLGECAIIETLATLDLQAGASALIAWPA
ncbi:MAG: class I mannose-6-phosphate isomerase [Pseudomonadota bacterium]